MLQALLFILNDGIARPTTSLVGDGNGNGARVGGLGSMSLSMSVAVWLCMRIVNFGGIIFTYLSTTRIWWNSVKMMLTLMIIKCSHSWLEHKQRLYGHINSVLRKWNWWMFSLLLCSRNGNGFHNTGEEKGFSHVPAYIVESTILT